MESGPIELWDPLAALGRRWKWRRKVWRTAEDRGRLAELRRIVEAHKIHPVIRAMAIRILRSYRAPSRDRHAQARAIQAWVQSNLLYIPEPGDTWMDPLRTLWIGGGDCDDHAIVVASLLEAIRIPTRFVVLRRRGRGFHVYAEAGFPDRRPATWVPVETVLPVPFGWDPKHATPEEMRRFR